MAETDVAALVKVPRRRLNPGWTSGLNTRGATIRPDDLTSGAPRRIVSGIPRVLLRLLALSTVMLWLSPAPSAWAQSVANLERESDRIKDSLKTASWDYFFPIWGKKVVAKGFELPLPVGINVQYLYNFQELDIGNLHLGVNNGGLVNVSDLIDVGQSSVSTNSLQFRPDLWVLPFLNVYGILGVGTNSVDVTVGKPVEFKTLLDRNATLYGFGGNISGALSRYFVVVDGNMSWASVAGIDQATRAWTISGRIGRTFLLSKQMRITGWVGAMNLGIASETSGSIRVGDALPGLEDAFEDYQNEQWYQDLRPGQQQRIDSLFSQIVARDPANSTIQYSIDKELASKWSIVFGGQFQFTQHWMLRWEYSQSDTRAALLLNLNYRVGF